MNTPNDKQLTKGLGKLSNDEKVMFRLHAEGKLPQPQQDRSTKAQWEQLAHEAIGDAGYWKQEARKAQGQRDELLSACQKVERQLNNATSEPREPALTLTQLRQILNTAIANATK